MNKVSPKAALVVKYSNLLKLGFKIDLDELDAETVNGIEYYGMKRRAKEREEEFKVLFEGLSKLLKFK